MAEEKKAKKPGFFKRMQKSFRDMVGEIKKVVWPTKKQILNNTGIVIVVVVISAAFIGGFDALLKVAVDLFLRAA